MVTASSKASRRCLAARDKDEEEGEAEGEGVLLLRVWTSAAMRVLIMISFGATPAASAAAIVARQEATSPRRL